MMIETPRTKLRMLTLSDHEQLAAILAKPSVMKYLGANCQPVSPEETKDILESILRLWERKGFGRLAVVSKEDDRLIGIAGLRFFDGDAELFYLLDEPYWNQGLATEVGRAVLEFGFGRYDFPRIIAVTRAANLVSIRVLEKLGFKFQKTGFIVGVCARIYHLTREDFENGEK